MRAYDRLPDFRFIYKTDRKDTVVVRLPAEGLLGVIGKKNEWAITQANWSQCWADIVGRSPIYLSENGTLAEVEAEIKRWMFPSLHAAAQVWA